MNILYKILWAFDAIITLIVLYFFVVGLGDGSISSFNITLWMLILAVVGGVMLGSMTLKARNHTAAAIVVLCILAAPGLLYALFLIALMGVTDWK